MTRSWKLYKVQFYWSTNILHWLYNVVRWDACEWSSCGLF